MLMNYSTPDLTQHPPRSPRARMGGYVLLPRNRGLRPTTPSFDDEDRKLEAN